MPDQLLFRLERQGYPTPDYEVSRWIDDGRVVLDIDNRPVNYFTNIPLTLSSEMEGYLMEMINRMDMRITQRDFRARMPHTSQTKTGTKPIMSTNAIEWRLNRFRLENACPSWNDRQNPGPLKSLVLKLLSEEGRKRNSTQELSGLTKLQQEIVTKGTKPGASSRPSTLKSKPVSHAPQSEAAQKYTFKTLLRGRKRKRGDDSSSESDDESHSPNRRPTKVARTDPTESRGGPTVEQANPPEIKNSIDWVVIKHSSLGEFDKNLPFLT